MKYKTRKELKKAIEGKDVPFKVWFICPVCGKEVDGLKESFIHVYAHNQKQLSTNMPKLDSVVKQVEKELLCGEPTGKKYMKMKVEFYGGKVTVENPQELHKFVSEAEDVLLLGKVPMTGWTVLSQTTKIVMGLGFAYVAVHAGTSGLGYSVVAQSQIILIAYALIYNYFKKAGEAEAFPFDSWYALILAIVLTVDYGVGLLIGVLT